MSSEKVVLTRLSRSKTSIIFTVKNVYDTIYMFLFLYFKVVSTMTAFETFYKVLCDLGSYLFNLNAVDTRVILFR